MASTFLGLQLEVPVYMHIWQPLTLHSTILPIQRLMDIQDQEVTRVESESLRTFNKTGTVGTGVTATSISQIRDTYYDYKYWENNQKIW